MDNIANLINGLNYVMEVLNTMPVTGVENCQKVINATINVKIAIATFTEIQNGEKEISNEDNKRIVPT